MIRAVLDTNIIVSALTFPADLQQHVLRRAAQYQYEIIMSAHLFREVATTLAKPYFQTALRGNPHGDLYDAILQIPAIDIYLEVSGVATHVEDDLVLATAVSGHADYLVTGDEQLLRLGRFEGVQIVDSRKFLDILDQQAGRLEDPPLS